jgi:predicted protein tyrosine phosphatase
MKILFICNLGRNRSRTAAELFKNFFETKARGIYSNDVTENDIAWADTVVVMEPAQRKFIGDKFPALYLQKKIICLDIPDTYYYNQPELVKILEQKIPLLTRSIS